MPKSDPLARPEQQIRRVYAYVAYRIGDGPDAEDVTSETFARAVRYRASFDPAAGDPLAWLIGIARRCVAGHLGEQTAVAGEPPELESPLDLGADVARRIDLAAALATLSERDRELVALRYGADLTAGQIGNLLEVKTNAVEVALHRALARLRGELEGDGSRASSTHPSASISPEPS